MKSDEQLVREQENNFCEMKNRDIFDNNPVDDRKMVIGNHYLIDLYANEIWEVEKTKNKIYNKKRRRWFPFKPIEFICNSEKYGSPNGYFSITIKDRIYEKEKQ